MRESVERNARGVVVLVMIDHSKSVSRIIVCAPRRGKLALEWTYEDGTGAQSPTDVSTIRRVLGAYGQEISIECLSQIAFCGGRLILTKPK